jgi:hypothetical protein
LRGEDANCDDHRRLQYRGDLSDSAARIPHDQRIIQIRMSIGLPYPWNGVGVHSDPTKRLRTKDRIEEPMLQRSVSCCYTLFVARTVYRSPFSVPSAGGHPAGKPGNVLIERCIESGSLILTVEDGIQADNQSLGSWTDRTKQRFGQVEASSV